jgi:hypothetical protein
MIANATDYYVPPTAPSGPSTATGDSVATVAPAPVPTSPYIPQIEIGSPLGGDWDSLGGTSYVPVPGAIITETVDALGGGYYAAHPPPDGGPTCVRCQPVSSPNPNAPRPTPRPTAAPTATTDAFAKLAGLPWWVWVLGLVAVASAFADRK